MPSTIPIISFKPSIFKCSLFFTNSATLHQSLKSNALTPFTGYSYFLFLCEAKKEEIKKLSSLTIFLKSKKRKLFKEEFLKLSLSLNEREREVRYNFIIYITTILNL